MTRKEGMKGFIDILKYKAYCNGSYSYYRRLNYDSMITMWKHHLDCLCKDRIITDKQRVTWDNPCSAGGFDNWVNRNLYD